MQTRPRCQRAWSLSVAWRRHAQDRRKARKQPPLGGNSDHWQAAEKRLSPASRMSRKAFLVELKGGDRTIKAQLDRKPLREGQKSFSEGPERWVCVFSQRKIGFVLQRGSHSNYPSLSNESMAVKINRSSTVIRLSISAPCDPGAFRRQIGFVLRRAKDRILPDVIGPVLLKKLLREARQNVML